MSMPEILEENMTESQRLAWSMLSLNTAFTNEKLRTDKHQKLLIDGNGELPLVEQVRNLNTFVNGVRYWMKFLIGALLLQTLTFMTTAVIYFIKLAPYLDQLSKNP